MAELVQHWRKRLVARPCRSGGGQDKVYSPRQALLDGVLSGLFSAPGCPGSPLWKPRGPEDTTDLLRLHRPPAAEQRLWV